MKSKIEQIKKILTKLNWLPPLVARLSVGVVFAESGWGKIHNLQQVTDYFNELGIPFAAVQAPFVAGLELVGGSLLILGLATRLTTIPLMAVMTVAIVTAKAAEISSASDIFGFSEFLYIVLSFWLLIVGPGNVSFDWFISQKAEG